jgi:hypothetical protein
MSRKTILHPVYQESCVIVRLYNFIASNYVEPLKPSNQMSTVKYQIIVIFLYYSIF